MKFNKETAKLVIPDKSNEELALSRTTHLSIAAHQDDVEIMAYHGIIECYQKDYKHFSAVIVTNGSGSARDDIYKNYTDEEMIQVRREEQIKAAVLGEYSSLALLDYPSKEVKDGSNNIIVDEFVKLIKATSPEVIYTHNLADKHDTHIGVVTKTIKAIRKLDKKYRPLKVYGCEVWRDLDWILDKDKVIFDVSKNPKLALDLVNQFESQIIGGKRYDLATIGRRLANATFSSSHQVDESNAITYAMDLTPLIEDDTLSISSFIEGYLDQFKLDVIEKLNRIN